MLRSAALNLYRWGTLPVRSWLDAASRRQGRSPIMILFYHRVADVHPNSWTIGRRAFTKQISWIRDHFEFVSLGDARQRVAAGSNAQPVVSLTFDDGYAENSEFALPWLAEQRIPYTYFVTTENVFQQQPFPHDVAAGQPLPPNTPEQLRQLAAAGADIGAHTRSHLDLGPVDDLEVLRDEIVGSRDKLQQYLGRAVPHFAFPFGLHVNLNRAAFGVAADAGFDAVCSAYGGYNFPGDDPFHLRRIHGDPEMARLKNWLTLDPRKLNRRDTFDQDSQPPITAPDGGAVL